ncbi:MAG TPA: FtsX-like permease family protein [Thermoanaerobaculia bacterium]|nr:FtsX-like permease family protein [Thermoanaerobaculia bacterium]
MLVRTTLAALPLALVLAGVGLYGVISYSVARRTQELGLRQALGAAPSAILWLVLRETLILAVAGVALGVPAALAGGRLIASRLVGLSVGDPLTLVLATLMLLLVALAAGTLPGARATRVDPVRALQGD